MIKCNLIVLALLLSGLGCWAQSGEKDKLTKQKIETQFDQTREGIKALKEKMERSFPENQFQDMSMQWQEEMVESQMEAFAQSMEAFGEQMEIFGESMENWARELEETMESMPEPPTPPEVEEPQINVE